MIINLNLLLDYSKVTEEEAFLSLLATCVQAAIKDLFDEHRFLMPMEPDVCFGIKNESLPCLVIEGSN